MNFDKGAKVYFQEEKRPYVVRACGTRWVVCTKPHNPRRTVLYTIIDLKLNIRGPENLIFGLGAETDEECEAMLRRLEAGQSEVSQRRFLPCRIEVMICPPVREVALT